MEDNLEKIVSENVTQFSQYQGMVSESNASIGSLRNDLGRALKQRSEMENINECMEQRID